jgi:hypothetical protein
MIGGGLSWKPDNNLISPGSANDKASSLQLTFVESIRNKLLIWDLRMDSAYWGNKPKL